MAAAAEAEHMADLPAPATSRADNGFSVAAFFARRTAIEIRAWQNLKR